MPNEAKHSVQFNFRIQDSLWKQLNKAVKIGGYYTKAQFLREALREKIERERLATGKSGGGNGR